MMAISAIFDSFLASEAHRQRASWAYGEIWKRWAQRIGNQLLTKEVGFAQERIGERCGVNLRTRLHTPTEREVAPTASIPLSECRTPQSLAELPLSAVPQTPRCLAL